MKTHLSRRTHRSHTSHVSHTFRRLHSDHERFFRMSCSATASTNEVCAACDARDVSDRPPFCDISRRRNPASPECHGRTSRTCAALGLRAFLTFVRGVRTCHARTQPSRTNARPIDAWAVLPGPGRACDVSSRSPHERTSRHDISCVSRLAWSSTVVGQSHGPSDAGITEVPAVQRPRAMLRISATRNRWCSKHSALK